jgi:hypothetical protein
LLPTIAGLKIVGLKILYETGDKGVCCPVICLKEKMKIEITKSCLRRDM